MLRLIISCFLLGITANSKRFSILVIGGSGRVGGSAVRSIYNRYGGDVDITVAGRDVNNWNSYKDRVKTQLPIPFVSLNIESLTYELEKEINKHDLIINTAGPFQQLRTPVVLNCSLSLGKMYLDVCDDIELSRICRSKYQDLTKKTFGSAIISTGIWPGASSLLAQEVIHRCGGKDQVEKVIFSFFTAGSGGAGPTILTATFLILGEKVLIYRDGKPEYRKSATDPKTIDFGRGFGRRQVVRLNLIECESCASSGIPSVETFFGTAPPFWNTLFVYMANLIPQNILQNRAIMAALARFSLPMVRLVDNYVGSRNGIRVDVTLKSGSVATALLTHEDMEKAVGDAIAAFAHQMLFSANSPPPGVYFPEEVPGDAFRKEILSEVAADAISYSYLLE